MVVPCEGSRHLVDWETLSVIHPDVCCITARRFFKGPVNVAANSSSLKAKKSPPVSARTREFLDPEGWTCLLHYGHVTSSFQSRT